MQLRNQVEWAIHCCVVLGSLAPDERLSTKTLSEFHGVPKEYLSKALQSLAQADLVEGSLGPTGGYRLAQPPSQISLLQIVEAIEGSKRTFNCEEIRSNNPCIKNKNDRPTGVCAVARAMYRADEAWRKELRKVSLADIADSVSRDVSKELLEKTQLWFNQQ